MIFVVGMHRSGTSFVANLFRDLGVNFGSERELLEAQLDNPEGFAEYKEVVELHDSLLTEQSLSWYQPSAHIELSASQKKRIQQLRNNLEGVGLEAVKDPRLSLFVTDWIQEDDEVWICLRDPNEVCESLFVRDAFPYEASAALWLIYNKAIIDGLAGKKYQVIWFSELRNDLKTLVAPLENRFGDLSGEIRSVLTSRFKPGYANNSQKVLDTLGEFRQLAKELYSECLVKGSLSPFSELDSKPLEDFVRHFAPIVSKSREYRDWKSEIPHLKARASTLQDLLDERNEEFDLLAEAHKNEVSQHKQLELTYKRLESDHEKLVLACKLQKEEFEQFQNSLYEYKQALAPRFFYFLFRLYKRVTARSSTNTFIDTVFKEYPVPEALKRKSRFNTIRSILKFVVANPEIATRNLTIRNIKILLRKITGNGQDLQQWLSSRIPVTSECHPLEIEQFERGEVLDFPLYESPKVSIIVPVYNQIEITLSLLKSLTKHTDVPYEVIIADDNSQDETKDLHKFVKNVQHVRNEKNLGFLLNCNNAAKSARGEYLVFLNNDTNVCRGWLDNLLMVFDDPDVGIAGPKILFREGQLQEAGGIVWKDASGWNYGRMQDPAAPEFNYRKEVDYVSGCCLMIRTSLWEAIGGFDQRYVPAYYEDTDICFEARQRYFKVVYQPASTVIHFEGASHGTDTSAGIKHYQVVNREKFLEKWKIVLEQHQGNGVDVFHSRDRSRDKKCILFIDHYVPWFDKDAGSRAVFMYLELLIDMGYNIKFIGDNFYKHEPYTSALQQMGIEVLYGNHYAANIDTWIEENSNNIDIAFLNRPHVAERYIDLLKKQRIHVVYFGHDLHFLRLQRQAKLESCEKKEKESEKWRVRELDLMEKSDVVYYPSTVEVEILRQNYGVKHSEVLPLFLYPKESASPKYEPGERKGLLFVGGFGHPPNVDAVEWFYESVFSQLSEDALPVYIVGSNVPKHIADLSSDQFKVLGYQSDAELETLYRKVKLAIVPLRYGAGVKGKVLEAMYHAVPVVGTTVALEGIEGVDEAAFEANSAIEFANVINELVVTDETLRESSTQSAAFIRTHFNSGCIRAIFERDFALN